MRHLPFWLFLSLSWGCPRPVQPTTPSSPYSRVLVDPESLAGDFSYTHEVTMRYATGEQTFLAGLELQGNKLILVALGPHGGRAFVLTQIGTEVTYENFMPQELPFPAEYILYDIHRIFFAECQDMSGESCTEEVNGGTRMARHFRRSDGKTIDIRYGTGLPANSPECSIPPEVIVLENNFFGYTATLRRVDWAGSNCQNPSTLPAKI